MSGLCSFVCSCCLQYSVVHHASAPLTLTVLVWLLVCRCQIDELANKMGKYGKPTRSNVIIWERKKKEELENLLAAFQRGCKRLKIDQWATAFPGKACGPHVPLPSRRASQGARIVSAFHHSFIFTVILATNRIKLNCRFEHGYPSTRRSQG